MKECGLPIRVAAPCRADLAGGTLDIWPLGQLHPGSVTVNMALDIEVVLEVDVKGDPGSVVHRVAGGDELRLDADDATTDLTAAVAFAMVPEGGVRVRVERQAPYCSGIGGSSSYGIALGKALGRLRGSSPDDQDLVALVRDLEARILGVPTGEQDHWAAVRGGILAIHLEAGGNRLERLDVALDWLADRASVFFSGIRHRSGMVNWQVLRRRLDGERETTEAFSEIAAAARDCRGALLAHDEGAVAEALRREWTARRRLAPEVCPPELELLLQTAHDNGVTGAKACGAGGGGSVLLWHPAGAREGVVASLEAASDGGRLIAAGGFDLGCRFLGRATRES